jgi:hypothetical protein
MRYRQFLEDGSRRFGTGFAHCTPALHNLQPVAEVEPMAHEISRLGLDRFLDDNSIAVVAKVPFDGVLPRRIAFRLDQFTHHLRIGVRELLAQPVVADLDMARQRSATFREAFQRGVERFLLIT